MGEVTRLKHPIATVPRDGRYIIVGCEDGEEHVMRWSVEQTNDLVQDEPGIWVSRGDNYTWSEKSGFGPDYWRPCDA